MKVKRFIPVLFMALMLFLIYLPILILAIYSFTTSTNIGSIRGFTMQNYVTLFTNEELRSMMIGTFLLAIGSAILATILGSLGAIGAFYAKGFGKNYIASLNHVPVVNADVVTGFSICIALVVVCGIDKSTFIPLVIGHVVLSAPFVYLAVIPKLKQLDSSLYEAAMDLGATPHQALTKVVLPQIAPGIVSGFALAITLSLDDYFIASYTKPATFDTISTYVVNATRGSQTEIKTALWALSTVLFVVVIVLVACMNGMNNRKENRKNYKTLSAVIISVLAVLAVFSNKSPIFAAEQATETSKEDTIVLRVCNWEEYIDLGDWDEEEAIELDNGQTIFGEKPLYKEFEDWYYNEYGQRVKVEYSCFGTNEELYNQLTLGDCYDLVCPSDYMLMKLMQEDQVVPFSKGFFDESNALNYYINGVSPYIRNVFENYEIDGKIWSDYAACYMWGLTGVLYNPEYMTEEEASTWAVFNNPKFYRQITLKDNVRDTYFAALGYLQEKKLMDPAFMNDPDYYDNLEDVLNDVSPDTIAKVQELLQEEMGNIYALETDSGKADMITGKIVANYQWSGDAVYAMDQADEDGVELRYAIPREGSNLWLDGWIMLKKGIAGDERKQQAAEAFINFLSRPDNAVRDMYYIGYTSAIAGGDDDTVFSYVNYNYGAEDDEESVEHPLGYFFSGDVDDADYVLHAPVGEEGRQLYTQYPSEEDISRSVIMRCFNEEETKNINQMWINIRCYNIKNVPVWCIILVILLLIITIVIIVRNKRYKNWVKNL